METATATRVSLELGHSAGCDEFAGPLYMQMSHGNYDECAVQPLPRRIQEWRDRHRTARKRADRAARRGYRFLRIRYWQRADEIYAINVSAEHRQGRPMSLSYRQHPSQAPDPRPVCARHAIRTYGVEDAAGTLVAYLRLYRAGELGLVSQILGHAGHLENEIMFLLVQGTLDREQFIAPHGFAVYNRWDSGTDGLRFFKERLGFQPMAVEWLP